LYALFSVWWAYVILKAFIFLVGFYSFRFWIRKQDCLDVPLHLEPFIALLWASLAFYIHRGIGIAALPLIVGIFQELFRGKSKFHFYLALIFYGFFSKLTLTGLYIWIGLFAWVIWVVILYKKPMINSFKALSTLLLVWIIQEHQLIHGLFFNPGFQSHREDFSYDFGIWANQMPWDFFLSGDQNGVFYAPLYALIIPFFAIIGSKDSISFIKGRNTLFLVLTLSTLLALFSFSGLATIMGNVLPVLASLNFFRFEYWIPFLLFSTFIYWWSATRFRFRFFLILILLTANIFIYQYEWRYWINSYLGILPQKVPTFKEYYAVDQWNSIRDFLEKDTSNPVVVHFNIPPAVSAYNGLKSLDGYLQIYPRAKKHQVYRVVSAELKKDPSLEDHLLKWGNKCYFQNAQFPDDYAMYAWRKDTSLDEPSYDYSYLRDSLGATHVLAALPVRSSQLRFIKKFEDPNSAWNVYLYSLDTDLF
jgi:hypothetical protein